MEENERKVYEVKGTVQISSEEYRDLIEEVANMKLELEKKDNNYWNEYRAKRKAEDALKEKTEQFEELLGKYKKLKELIIKRLSTESKDADSEKNEDPNRTVVTLFAEFFKD